MRRSLSNVEEQDIPTATVLTCHCSLPNSLCGMGANLAIPCVHMVLSLQLLVNVPRLKDSVTMWKGIPSKISSQRSKRILVPSPSFEDSVYITFFSRSFWKQGGTPELRSIMAAGSPGRCCERGAFCDDSRTEYWCTNSVPVGSSDRLIRKTRLLARLLAHWLDDTAKSSDIANGEGLGGPRIFGLVKSEIFFPKPQGNASLSRAPWTATERQHRHSLCHGFCHGNSQG